MTIDFDKNLSWSFSKNPEIFDALKEKYPPHHGYWEYLDGLISDLRTGKCEGIQEKLADVANNSSKFKSAVSELEIARVLIQHHKSVKLLPDAYMGKSGSGNEIPSPDMLATDTTGEYYVEVNLFSDDETSGLIVDDLRAFLADSKPPCRVDVSLPQTLSLPANSYAERSTKYTQIKRILEDFKPKFTGTNRNKLPLHIKADGAVFDVSTSGLGKSYPGMVTTDAFQIPSQQIIQIIQYRLSEKAKKRLKWTGNNLDKRYIVAIDCDQITVNDFELYPALIGTGNYYQLKPPAQPIPAAITNAANAGWRTFLESVHLIPVGHTIINPYGCYLTDPLTANVSGVLFRVGSKLWFIPNPFADPKINDPKILQFLA
jgi:hypothetical protein